jgi:hypothetical protein
MIFLQTHWILAFVCAFTFFGAGKAEAKGGGPDHAFLWAGLSVVTSAVFIELFDAGWFLVLLGQAGLFIGIGIFRAMRDR